MTKYSDIIVGIIGLIIFCIGTLLPGAPIQIYFFFVGALLLTLSSYLSKNLFFALLEGIVSIGALLSILSVATDIKGIVIVVLVVVTIIYLAKKGMLKDKNFINGIIGLVFLVVGAVFYMPIGLIISGVFLSIYALVVFKRGEKIGMVFFVLNVIFTITSLLGFIKTLH
ncbi:MAG: hypothetical protein NTX05_07205 [Fusobacteria bacterium]|nr:hypothetical protein [Fusobacteriota bacterium]